MYFHSVVHNRENYRLRYEPRQHEKHEPRRAYAHRVNWHVLVRTGTHNIDMTSI